MKFKKSLSKLLTNKYVLYSVFTVAFLNNIGYIMLGNINAFVCYILIGLVVSYFSKNMILILAIPLILVNLMVVSQKTVEGLTNKTDDKMTDDTEEHDTKKHSNNKDHTKDKKNTVGSDVPSEIPVQNDSFEVGRKKGGKYNIDYASTVGGAYDELNKIIGGDGMKQLTNDTQNLMKQQLQLAEAMNNMEPMIASMGPIMSQASAFMSTMGNNKGFEGIADLAKSFKPSLTQS